MKYCETCKYYHHTPNILGGVSRCLLEVKNLMTFCENKACGLYKETNIDKLKAQNDYYKKYLSDKLQITKNGLVVVGEEDYQK